MKVVNYSELRSGLKKYLDLCADTSTPVIVSRPNQQHAVFIPLEEYTGLRETAALLSGKERDAILRALEEGKSLNH